MSLSLTLLTIMSVTAVVIAAVLLMRRRAPVGGYFADGDRAAGAFGVLATGFSVLLGLIVFLAFSSYDQSRSGAEAEALAIVQQFETAQFLPAESRQVLDDGLVCYARSIVGVEWPVLKRGEEVPIANPWAVTMFTALKTIEPNTASQQAAYDKWLDRTADREAARQDRIHGAVGVIPIPLWIALIFISLVIFLFMLFFADPAERAVSQAMLVGSVTSVIVAMLILIGFLDSPYRPGIGGIKPVAMERTLRILDAERTIVRDSAPLPCDKFGRPTSS